MCRAADFKFASYLPMEFDVIALQGYSTVQLELGPRVPEVVTDTTHAELYAATGAVGGVLVARLSALPSLNPSSEVFETQLPAASSSIGFVRSASMYSESPTVRATIQLRDSITLSTLTAVTPIRVVVLHEADLLWHEADLLCSSQRGGICQVDMTLPNSFVARVGHGGQLDMKYMLLDAAVPTFVSIGEVLLWQSQSLGESTANTIYTVLPERDMYPGDTVDIEIRSLFPVHIKTAEVRVTLSSGLEIIRDAPAKDSKGKDVFFGTMDRESKLVSASLARKEGTPLETDGQPTNELLFTLTIKVQNDAAQLGVVDGFVTVEGIRFKDGNEALLDLDATGAVVSRSGEVINGPGAIKIKANAVVKAMSHAVGPTELLNTAMISGTPIHVPIQVVGFKVRGEEVDITDTCTCTSRNPDVLQVDESNCVAILDGTESRGARSVEIVAECDDALTAITYFRVHLLTRLRLEVGSTQIQPIAGWFNDGVAPSCDLLKYQSVPVIARATFSDGNKATSMFADYDVSSIVQLRTSDERIASVSNVVRSEGVLVDGETPGAFVLSAVARNGSTLTAVSMKVMAATGQSMLAVIGIDVHVVHQLGNVTFAESSILPRNHTMGISVAKASQINLQYEGDAMSVVAWAVLDDHSRVPLTPANGLVITSLNNAAAAIITDGESQRIVVVPNPEQHTGPLLDVLWAPSGDCFENGPGFTGHAHRQIDLEVSPPPAEKMVATASSALLVGDADVATNSGAGYPTSAQIEVSLHFSEGKVQPQLQTDSRALFTASEDAPFTVNSNGTVFARANGAVGIGFVTVTFNGQNVTDVVTIEVTRFASLSVVALPEPAYPGSSSVSVKTLSAIECTTNPVQFQKAKLQVTIILQNGVEKRIPPQFTRFRVADAQSGATSDILSEAERVVVVNSSSTATANGSRDSNIFARFGSIESAEPLVLTILDASAVVTIAKLDNMQLHSNTNNKIVTTLTGEQGVASGNVQLGATLSDERQYTALFEKGQLAGFSIGTTPVLAGALSFESLNPTKLEVDADHGTVRLLNNHYEPVSIVARTCTDSYAARTSTISISANLRPVTTGDVDLGVTSGPPVAGRVVGSTIKIPVRINTGGKKLAAFNLRIQFDPTMLSPVLSQVRHIIPASKGAVDMKASVSETGDEIVLAAVIQRSSVKGGVSGFPVAEVVFTSSVPGVTTLAGIAVQLLDNTPGNPQPIGEPNAPFKAGEISLAILDGSGGRGRRDNYTAASSASSTAAVMQTQHRTLQRLSAHVREERSRFAVSEPAQGRRGLKGALGRADANCDGKISLEDPIRINDFIAARNGDFQTSLGKSIAAANLVCRDKLGVDADDTAFLDPDGNTVVEGIDATYLLDIMVQNFYFYDVTINAASQPSCYFTVQVYLTTPSGSGPRAGTRLLLDFGFDSAINNPLLAESFENTGYTLTADKGSTDLHGMLVEAQQSGSDLHLFEFAVNVPFVEVDLAGLSLIQIANAEMAVSPRWKLFAGSEVNPRYASPLLYTARILDADSALIRASGYNPLIPDVHLALPTCQITTPTSTTVTATVSTTTSTSTITATVTSTTATTATATATTTTVSSTSTATALSASYVHSANVFECKETGASVSMIAVRTDADCPLQAKKLNSVLHDCSSASVSSPSPGQQHSSSVVTSCGTVLGMDDVLVDSLGIRSCSMTALTISKALMEFNGVEDENTPAIGCLLQTIAVSQNECQSVAAKLNQMVMAYEQGLFTNCTASTTSTTSTTNTSTSTTTTVSSSSSSTHRQQTPQPTTTSENLVADSRMMLVIDPPFEADSAETFRFKVLHLLYTKGFVTGDETVEATTYGTYVIEVVTHDTRTTDAIRSAARSRTGIHFDLDGVWYSADLLEDVYVSKPGDGYEQTSCAGTRFGTLRFPEVQFAPGEGELIKSFENNTLDLVQAVAAPFGIQIHCARMVSYPEDGTDVELYLSVADFSQAGSDSAPNFPAMCGGLTKELIRLVEVQQGVTTTFVVALTTDFNVRPTIFAPHLCSQSGIVAAPTAPMVAPTMATLTPLDGNRDVDSGIRDADAGANDGSGELKNFSSNFGSNLGVFVLEDQLNGGGTADNSVDVSQRTLAIVAVTVSCLAVLGCVHSLLLYRTKRRNARMAAALERNSNKRIFGGLNDLYPNGRDHKGRLHAAGISGIGRPVPHNQGAWASSFDREGEYSHAQHHAQNHRHHAVTDGDDELIYDDLEFNGQAALEAAAEESAAARAAKARLRSPNTLENRRKQADLFSRLLNQQNSNGDGDGDGDGDNGGLLTRKRRHWARLASNGSGDGGANQPSTTTAVNRNDTNGGGNVGGSDEDDNALADVTYMAATSKAVPEDALGAAHWNDDHTYETATNLLNNVPSTMEIYEQPPSQAGESVAESVAESQAESILYNNVDEFPELLPAQQQVVLGSGQGQQSTPSGARGHRKQTDADLLTATMGTLAGRWQAEQAAAILAGFDGGGGGGGTTSYNIESDFAPPGTTQFGLVDDHHNNNASSLAFDSQRNGDRAAQTPPPFESPALPTAFVYAEDDSQADSAYPAYPAFSPERVPSEYLGVFSPGGAPAASADGYLGVMPSTRTPPPMRRTPGGDGDGDGDGNGDGLL